MLLAPTEQMIPQRRRVWQVTRLVPCWLYYCRWTSGSWIETRNIFTKVAVSVCQKCSLSNLDLLRNLEDILFTNKDDHWPTTDHLKDKSASSHTIHSFLLPTYRCVSGKKWCFGKGRDLDSLPPIVFLTVCPPTGGVGWPANSGPHTFAPQTGGLAYPYGSMSPTMLGANCYGSGTAQSGVTNRVQNVETWDFRGSIGLVYLPAWMVDLYGKLVGFHIPFVPWILWGWKL